MPVGPDDPTEEVPRDVKAAPEHLVDVRASEARGPAPFGVADAHGVVAVVCGMGVLCMSCVCCIDPIRDDDVAVAAVALAVGGMWSGLFGIVTHGTRGGRALAVIGLGAIILSSFLMCFAATLGNRF